MAVASILAALGIVELDRAVLSPVSFPVLSMLEVSAEAARSVLSTIAGSMMTVTGVVFSITVVALTLASSQFGPRLLRTFLRDRGSQFAFGTFLATFCYSLIVLRSVGSPDEVPTVATALGVVLAISSLFVLIYFIHHVASSIQASTVIAAVAAEIDEQLEHLVPEGAQEDRASSREGAEPHQGREDGARPSGACEAFDSDTSSSSVVAQSEGFVRVIDRECALRAAEAHDLLIRYEIRPGDFVTTMTEVARVTPEDRVTDDVLRAVHQSYVVGDHRTPVQDLRFLTDQLSEMAVRALSPGLNDPNTAIECIQRLGSVVERLAARRMPAGSMQDASGVLRVTMPEMRFDAILGSCFDELRSHGADDPDVAIALIDALGRAASRCREPDRIDVLREHLDETRDAFRRSSAAASARDRTRVDAAHRRAAQRIESAAPAQAGPRASHAT
jgi:uncharacterized membrane protein